MRAPDGGPTALMSQTNNKAVQAHTAFINVVQMRAPRGGPSTLNKLYPHMGIVDAGKPSHDIRRAGARKMRNNGGKEKEQRWDEKDPRSGPALDAHFAT